jgi:hypothetical protein
MFYPTMLRCCAKQKAFTEFRTFTSRRRCKHLLNFQLPIRAPLLGARNSCANTMDSAATTGSFTNNEGSHNGILEDYKVATSIVDVNVVRAVHHIQTMLQIYGPLTHAQLKHNLPSTLVGLIDNSKLQQILDVLVALGILNIVDEEKTAAAAAAAKAKSRSTALSTTGTDDKGTIAINQDSTSAPRSSVAVRYVFMMSGGKMPRFDNITVPMEITTLNSIAETNMEEITDRIKLLRQELIQTGPSRRRTAHSFLSELLQKYPSLQNDALYSAALENAHKLGRDI